MGTQTPKSISLGNESKSYAKSRDVIIGSHLLDLEMDPGTPWLASNLSNPCRFRDAEIYAHPIHIYILLRHTFIHINKNPIFYFF